MTVFHLKISTSDGNLFDGDVTMLSLRGADGDLAILAGHIPFITSVVPCTVVLTLPDETKKEGHIESGLLSVSKDCVTLLSSSFRW